MPISCRWDRYNCGALSLFYYPQASDDRCVHYRNLRGADRLLRVAGARPKTGDEASSHQGMRHPRRLSQLDHGSLGSILGESCPFYMIKTHGV